MTTQPSSASRRVNDMMGACAAVGVEFVALAPRSAAWGWDGRNYWRVQPGVHYETSATAVAVDSAGTALPIPQRSATDNARRPNATAPENLSTYPRDHSDTTQTAQALTPPPAATPEASADQALLNAARLFQMRMLRDRRFHRTIIGADLARIFAKSDDAHTLLELFDDYTHEVPSDIAADVRAVLEWNPWTTRPPVYTKRSEVPEGLHEALTEAAPRHRKRS